VQSFLPAVRCYRLLLIKCAVKALDFRGCNSRPAGNWFAPPDGNRSRLFSVNEKHSFLGITLRAAGRALVRLKGVLSLHGPRPRCQTRQEKAIADLQGRLQPLLLRPQACPDCITLPKRALAGEARNASGREAFATEQPLAPPTVANGDQAQRDRQEIREDDLDSGLGF